MGYRSKRTIAIMGASILTLVAFSLCASNAAAPAIDDLKGWALLILIFIGIAIVAQIVIQILFHIAMAIGIAIVEGEEDAERILESDMVEDERDRQITLRSLNAAFIVVGIGFLAFLVLLAFGLQPSVAFIVLFVAFILSSLAEGTMSIYQAERGV